MSAAYPLIRSFSPSHGTSRAATTVDKKRVEVLQRMRLETPDRAAAINHLYTIAATMLPNENWSVVPRAVAFLQSLPSDAVVPEIDIEDDGEAAFDWMAPGKILTVSLEPTGRVAYAADLDDRATSNTFQLGDGLPAAFVEAVQAFRAHA